MGLFVGDCHPVGRKVNTEKVFGGCPWNQLGRPPWPHPMSRTLQSGKNLLEIFGEQTYESHSALSNNMGIIGPKPFA